MRRRISSDRLACGRGAQDGFILIAVLWMLAALAALVVIVSQQLESSARLLRLEDGAVQADALASAAIELSAYRLMLSKEEERPRQGSFRLALAGNDIAVSFVSEAARIDLNTATAAELETLPGIGPMLARRIIAGRPYRSVEDLSRVEGIGPRRLAEIRALVTVE